MLTILERKTTKNRNYKCIISLNNRTKLNHNITNENGRKNKIRMDEKICLRLTEDYK